LRDILILDGHAHLGEYANFFMNEPGAASMVAVMDRIVVQAAVVSANAAISSNTEYGNQMVLKAVRAFPGRFLGYVVANPWEAEDMEATLNRYLAEPGMVAIKLHPELPMILCGHAMPDVRQRPSSVPVCHTYFGGDCLEIPGLARKYPSVPLLVNHASQDLNLDAMVDWLTTCPTCISTCRCRNLQADRVLLNPGRYPHRFSAAISREPPFVSCDLLIPEQGRASLGETWPPVGTARVAGYSRTRPARATGWLRGSTNGWSGTGAHQKTVLGRIDMLIADGHLDLSYNALLIEICSTRP
jgi:hypothetical protein